jgi:hypothetical protein
MGDFFYFFKRGLPALTITLETRAIQITPDPGYLSLNALLSCLLFAFLFQDEIHSKWCYFQRL